MHPLPDAPLPSYTPPPPYPSAAGPPGLPLLGHSLALASPTAFRTLQLWSVQYGGAFRLSQGPLRPPLVVLSDPDAVHAVLALDEQHAVKSRRYYGSLEQVGGVGTGGNGCRRDTRKTRENRVRRQGIMETLVPARLRGNDVYEQG